ncbi:hypothetical protein P9743_09960 [Anoxybacillus geothermalis]|nr:hypothetical protein [Anoxybacillus geothermalis]
MKRAFFRQSGAARREGSAEPKKAGSGGVSFARAARWKRRS